MSAVSFLRLSAIALLPAGMLSTAQLASATTANACTMYAAEAASRSGLAVDIVLRVMMAESGGNGRIVSPKGAMGCMQIMPTTWGYLSARYNLGTDPFDARRNMIGGAMYLAELAGRYGFNGAIAAYNTGPRRYQRYVSGAAPLPAETIAYVARIGSPTAFASAPTATLRWQDAGLFLARAATPDPNAALLGANGATEQATRNPMFPLNKQ